jgi:hypothetical protein
MTTPADTAATARRQVHLKTLGTIADQVGEFELAVAPKADPTMAELAERYQREHVAMRRRPASVAHYGIMESWTP